MSAQATRDAYGNTLVELGKENSQIVVLDADLSCSTKTGLFAKAFPERFINVGVAEQDLMGTAAGLALMGKTVFATSFAMFATGRAWEIVRNSIGYPHLNVKICATHTGLTVGEDGASHQIVEDIALMRVIPGMQVFVPADGVETSAIIRSVSVLQGPVYVRLGRAKVPTLHDDSYTFEPGKGRVMREGNQVTLVACGIMVAEALKAAEILADRGISASVINMASVKPIDQNLLIQEAKKTNLIVTLEEHSVIGGLGSAVSEALSEEYPVKIKKIGLNDEYGESGPAEELLDKYGLLANSIVEKVQSYLS